jgi:hypothetical protein
LTQFNITEEDLGPAGYHKDGRFDWNTSVASEGCRIANEYRSFCEGLKRGFPRATREFLSETTMLELYSTWKITEVMKIVG